MDMHQKIQPYVYQYGYTRIWIEVPCCFSWCCPFSVSYSCKL